MNTWREHAATFAVLLGVAGFAGWMPPSATLNDNLAQGRVTPIEVLQVPELPLRADEAVLVKSDKSYLFRCSLSNTSAQQMIGLRYSLVVIDSTGQAHLLVNRTEGFTLEPYAIRRVTFRTPIKIKLNDGQRLVAMLEQSISPQSIWEVVKAKESMDAYVSGDYSLVPTVLRFANQLDAPLRRRVIYHHK